LLAVLGLAAHDMDDDGAKSEDLPITEEQIATLREYMMAVNADEKKFPTGPWCHEGDWVVFRAYSGTRIKIFGQEFRIINDDSVEAVVGDPRGVARV
jgi:hypothetical protein